MTKQMTTDRAGGTEPVPALARVSLREIREASFRALSAAGASHGEAWTAARMVLDAELQGEHGVEVLLGDVERGRWPKEGVDLAEMGSSERPVTRLGGVQSNRLLRHGPLAVNLAVAEPGHGVFMPGELPGLSCLDAVLLETALEQQHAIGVLRLGHGGASTCRVALDDGALGSGRLDERGLEGIEYEDLRLVTESVGAEQGVWVIAPPPRAVLDLPALTWVSAAQRADRRAAAARDGCLVDAVAWRCLYAASRHYLVA